MKNKACKICNSVNLELNLHTAKCKQCGVLLYYPYPEEENLQTSDKKEDIDSYKDVFDDWYKRASKLNHINFTRMFLFVIENPKDIKTKINILDYGAGGGQFTLVCKSLFPDCDVYSVDINDYIILDDYKPIIKQIKWNDFIENDIRFDYIFMNDVFEHLNNPIETLTILKKKLAINGKIFIDTPKQFWLFGFLKIFSKKLYSKLLKGTVSESHLQIWSKKSIKIVFEKNSLKIDKYEELSEFTMDYSHYLKNMKINNFLGVFLGKLFYHLAKYIARNKIMCTLKIN